MTNRPHGYARYRLDGCRCYTCGYARGQYDDNRNRALAYGTWKPWTDAEPVRAHIRALQACGLGARRIAELAHVQRKTVCVLLNGRSDRGTPPPAKVRPTTAAKILTVEATLDTLGSATLLNATGTRRRLQALVCAGWPQSQLAARLGMAPGNFGLTLNSAHVTVRTARAVQALYDELWRSDPGQHGASPGGVTRAKRYAAERHWAPVGAWDDDAIDDPEAQPQTGTSNVLSRDELAAVRRAEIEHFDLLGLSEYEIAIRLGMAYTTVRNIVLELRSGQRRIRPREGARSPGSGLAGAA